MCITTDYLNKKLQERRESIKERAKMQNLIEENGLVPINIIIDARRSSPRGYSAEECTVTIMEYESGKTIWVHHLERQLSRHYERRAYEGSSKSMEGFAVEVLMKDIKNNGFTVNSYVHDLDASTSFIITELFPKAYEERCIGHAAKNFRNKIIEGGKTYLHLAGYGDSAFRWILIAANMVKNMNLSQKEAIEQFKTSMEILYTKHSKCSHAPKNSKKIPVPTTEVETITTSATG